MDGDHVLPYLNFLNSDEHGISRSVRETPPAHYVYHIKSFENLLKTGISKCVSGDFEVGGYKWKLKLHPKGDAKRDVNSHISLYLAMSDKDTLPHGWEVKVTYRFFVFDKIRDKYLTIQDVDGKVRRFHKMKTRWGFTHLISHDTFLNTSNGFLVDDHCAFGVELLVIGSSARKEECLRILEEPQPDFFTWNVFGFSELDEEKYLSDAFTVEGRKWKICIYPKGNSGGKGYVSLFLGLDESEDLGGKKLYVKYTLRLRDHVGASHREMTIDHWFISTTYEYGIPKFMSLTDMKDTSKRHLVENCIIIEARILFMAEVVDI